MKPFIIDPGALGDHSALLGAIVTEDARAGGKRVFQKGQRIELADLDLLPGLDGPVHAVRLDPDDLHENVAGMRLARAVMGEGLQIRGPVQSRYNLVATVKGLLRVDEERLFEIDTIPGMAVFALPDRMVVVPGKVSAGVKITPVAAPEGDLARAEAIAAGQPIIRVLPFRPMKIGVVTTEGMAENLRERFREAVERKVGWFGAAVIGYAEPPVETDAVAAAIEQLIASGAEIMLLAGGNTIDPLDPALLALPKIGAEMLRFGAPAHPGSMFWMAQRGDVPIINLASCSMYSKSTVADLVLPRLMAGERVTANDLHRLGIGGLLDRGMSWRFPPYNAETADESGEE
ncbi:MAG: hypothetical protein ACR2J8_04000 [Thermomicrobiales bacterium]